MADGEYEIRNRHGDVVQRGQTEIAEVRRGAIWVELVDVAPMRNGDSLTSATRLSDQVLDEAFGD